MLREWSVAVASTCVVAVTSAADSPTGWALGNPREYSVHTDNSVLHDGKPTTRLSAKSNRPTRFGSLGRSLKGEAIRYLKGKRARFTAHVRSRGVDSAGLWMRVDGADSDQLAFDNMQENPISGDHEWQRYSIVLDVPRTAKAIRLGLCP